MARSKREPGVAVMVGLLVSFSASVGVARGQTASELRLAAIMKNCHYGCDEATYGRMKTLIGSGIDPNVRIAGENPFLLTAVVDQYPVDVVEALIKAGAAVNSTAPVPLLHAAVETAAMNPAAAVPVVKALIRGGARINALDANGYTPLMEASRGSAPPALIEDLIKAGADPTVVGPDGATALSLARKSLRELKATASPKDTPAAKETLAKMIPDRQAAVNVLENATARKP